MMVRSSGGNPPGTPSGNSQSPFNSYPRFHLSLLKLPVTLSVLRTCSALALFFGPPSSNFGESIGKEAGRIESEAEQLVRGLGGLDRN